MSSPRGQGQSLNEIDVPALAGRIAAAVRGAVVDPRPSDNFFIEDVFPADIYAQMLARLPGAEALDFIEHPDAATKIATLQFYLPKDLSQTHLGTTFHDRSEDGFVELKTNPFRPNSAYGFVRTDRSWHSVKELGAHEAVRNTIALTVYHQGLQYRSAM